MPAPEAPKRLDNARWLDEPETRAVFAALSAHGLEARAVGGAVRNALLGRPVGDVDIATPGLPQQVISAAEAAGLKAVPTGIDHGTVSVIAGGRPYEVTTLREDVETYGRRAKVAFTADWAADARRRDFTLNALYCTVDGALFDPLGGWPDLAARRIRFIGDARARIREDYLRILRFFRLAAEYGRGPLDEEGLGACVAERAGLALLSPERVRQELLRLLAAPRAPELVRIMGDYGLVAPVLGLAVRPTLIERVAEIEAALGVQPDAVLRLAALAVETREDADRLRERLRLSNEEHARLVRAVVAAAPPLQPEAQAKVALYKVGEDAYRQLALLAWARSQDSPRDKARKKTWALPERWRAPALPVKGDDVIALGVPAGPRVGKLLEAAEAWWIAQGFAADRAALLGKLRELARSG